MTKKTITVAMCSLVALSVLGMASPSPAGAAMVPLDDGSLDLVVGSFGSGLECVGKLFGGSVGAVIGGAWVVGATLTGGLAIIAVGVALPIAAAFIC